ncbi:sensor histidine kinase [Rhodococcus sp. ARC_M6]|uniref:sensor histidine kinase n=1 Tax=Rhodococcus sp. ARC_M6 TaxID=2928852 RepID=UPI001FB44B24|nr:histidine kinase [Rhodococcus sp. ARC_M6]MCJ0906700.1 histidine kinase [Rhodococcus sp. ARC_M6]
MTIRQQPSLLAKISLEARELLSRNPAILATIAGILSAVWVVGATCSQFGGKGYSGGQSLGNPGVLAGAAAILVALTVVACFRRRYPVWVYLLTLAGTVALAFVLEDRVAAATPLYWCAIAVLAGSTRGSRLALLVMIGMAADILLTTKLKLVGEGMTLSQVPIGDLPSLLFAPVVNIASSYAVMITIGLVVSRHRAQSSASAMAIDQMQLNHEARLSDAIAQERQNMARELHDVAAHHLTGMLIQAKSADKLFLSNPAQAKALLGGVIDHGDRALNSLRQTVGILRIGGTDPRYPQPMIADIPKLVEGCRASIPLLELDLEDAFVEIDSAVQLSSYRVVQEALSNVLRHAPQSSAKVSVRCESDSIRLDITNSAGMGAAATDGQSLGISGMRERVTLLGGTLLAGPLDNGWTVKAVIPTAGRIVG